MLWLYHLGLKEVALYPSAPLKLVFSWRRQSCVEQKWPVIMWRKMDFTSKQNWVYIFECKVVIRVATFCRSASCDSSASMSLIIGLEGLKERCFRNQKIIDKVWNMTLKQSWLLTTFDFVQLQEENRRLSANQRRYQSELSKISEDNESLRRTTEELNQVKYPSISKPCNWSYFYGFLLIPF